MSKSLATAYGIKRKSSKKMADGGPVEKSVWENLEDKVRTGFGDKPREEHQETQEERYARIRKQNQANMGYARGGMVHDPESVVSQIRKAMHNKKRHMAEGGEVEPDFGDETYPDPDMVEFDPLDENKPEHFADGGQVDPRQSAQDSMRKAFKFSEGGDVEESMEDKKKNRMKKIMHSMSK